MKEKYGESAIYIARSFPIIAIGRIQRYPRVLIRATVNSKILIESWFRHSRRQTRGSPGDGFNSYSAAAGSDWVSPFSVVVYPRQPFVEQTKQGK